MRIFALYLINNDAQLQSHFISESIKNKIKHSNNPLCEGRQLGNTQIWKSQTFIYFLIWVLNK